MITRFVSTILAIWLAAAIGIVAPVLLILGGIELAHRFLP